MKLFNIQLNTTRGENNKNNCIAERDNLEVHQSPVLNIEPDPTRALL